jgi:hypothetical protein
MKSNSSDGWAFNNNTLAVINGSGNGSVVEPYLQRLAHLDEGLYHDFYSLWITLMVINSLIFLVGTSFFFLYFY